MLDLRVATASGLSEGGSDQRVDFPLASDPLAGAEGVDSIGAKPTVESGVHIPKGHAVEDKTPLGGVASAEGVGVELSPVGLAAASFFLSVVSGTTAVS